MGPGVWENDRGGAIRVLQAFRQSMTPPPCFKYILPYIQGEAPPRYGHTASALL